MLVISAKGEIEGIFSEDEVQDDVQYFPGLLSPGFINCHCHLELSHMKGRIPEKTGLVDFVFNVVSERKAPDEKIEAAIKIAEQNMWESGIVAVGDICNNASTLAQKGKGRLQYHNFIEASGWLPSVAGSRFERAWALFQLFIEQNAGPTSIVPHAPYSVSSALWQKLRSHFENNVVSIHNQETRHEDDFFRHGTGDFNRMYALMNLDNTHHSPTNKSSLLSYFPHLENAASVLLVHNTFTQADDIVFVQQEVKRQPALRVSFCLCVNANLYIEDALPPVESLRQNQCNIVLGTDSLASNRSLSLVDEMKTIRWHFPQVSLEELLTWATTNGAAALNLSDRVGSFEKGKTPGVVNLSENLDRVQRII